LTGRGEPGTRGGAAGDLFVLIRVRPDSVFGRTGDDLTLTVPVTFAEAALGADLRVPTLDAAVTLRVPPGTPSGRTLRVRGKGVARRDGKVGDLLVTIDVHVPAELSDAARQALSDYAAAAPPAPRERLEAIARSAAAMNDEGRFDEREVFISFEAVSDAKVLIISDRRPAGRDAPADPAAVRPHGAGAARPHRRRRPPLQRARRRAAARGAALSQEEGVNLAGIKRIIELEGLVSDLRQRVADLEDELIRTGPGWPTWRRPASRAGTWCRRTSIRPLWWSGVHPEIACLPVPAAGHHLAGMVWSSGGLTGCSQGVVTERRRR
jgi:hypothetical protein